LIFLKYRPRTPIKILNREIVDYISQSGTKNFAFDSLAPQTEGNIYRRIAFYVVFNEIFTVAARDIEWDKGRGGWRDSAYLHFFPQEASG
jgi:hypothetical protein